MESDPYGIPESIFGTLDPELPALIGRIVILSALIESKVDSLASSLSREFQDVTAGRPFAVNLNACRTSLEQLAKDPTREKYIDTTATTLTEVAVALRARHEVAHRVWPHAGSAGWGGWKPTPKARREAESERWTDWRNFTRDELLGDVVRLVRLVDEIGDALAGAG